MFRAAFRARAIYRVIRCSRILHITCCRGALRASIPATRAPRSMTGAFKSPSARSATIWVRMEVGSPAIGRCRRSDESQVCSGDGADQSYAEKIVANVGVVVLPVGSSVILGSLRKRTPAPHPVPRGHWAQRVRYVARVRSVPVPDEFPDIAEHVVKAPCARLLCGHRMGSGV